jgi:hypothetical protein
MEGFSWIVIVWFCLSVLTAVICRLVFYFWLLGKGVEVRFFWAGTPGYLEWKYLEWCRDRGQSGKRWLRALSLLWVNLLVAAAVFAVLVVPRVHGQHTLPTRR